MSKEDDIHRCDECGNWKMKSARCRICQIAAGSETIKRRVFTGHKDMEVPIADL
jgi:recombinational DNA repair protein RecR